MLAVLPQVDRLFLNGPDRQGGRPHLTDATRYAPSTIPWPQHSSRTFNLQNEGRRTVFVIICLCYEGLEWREGGRMDMVGPKHDLLLLLSHLQYRHQNENRNFLIFTDFDLEFEDHTGFPGAIPRIAATRHNIATHIQATMRYLEREDKCVFYCEQFHVCLAPRKLKVNIDSGHIELDAHKTAHMVLQDNERIYDHELRAWLHQSGFSTPNIIAIFDACYSGGFLGLPYIHTKNGKHMNKTETAYYEEQMKSHVIEIASTAKHQLSFGKKFKGNKEAENTHGILTWHLLQYLKVNPRPDLHELVSHIYSKCETPWVDTQKQKWRQVPVLSCSRRIGGGTAFLGLR